MKEFEVVVIIPLADSADASRAADEMRTALDDCGLNAARIVAAREAYPILNSPPPDYVQMGRDLAKGFRDGGGEPWKQQGDGGAL